LIFGSDGFGFDDLNDVTQPSRVGGSPVFWPLGNLDFGGLDNSITLDLGLAVSCPKS
jgi:hypothetical protein